MKKLKIILQSKLFIFLVCLLTFAYCLLVINNRYYKTNYNNKTNSVIGVITNLDIDGNKVTINLRAKEKLIVNYYLSSEEELKIYNNYKLGDKLKVIGIFSKPNSNSNFNLFNYKNYLLSKKIYWIVDAKKIELVSKNNNIFYSIKNRIIKRLKKIDNAYLYTFIIGNNKKLNNDVLQSYQNNGISHLFALSGMHVSLITMFLLYLLNKINKYKKINYIIVSLVLIFYIFLSNFSVSIIRAVFLFIILCINNKRVKTINLYILLICVILIINPYNIYNNAFLFSYSITLYLILFSKKINIYKGYFKKLFLISLIAFLSSIPIMINSYFSINCISFILNLFFVPFVSFIILPLILLTFIFPFLNNVLVIFLNILEKSSLLITKFDIFSITMCHVNIGIIALYYIIITFVIYKILNKKIRYIILIIIMILIITNINYFKRSLFLTVIDVGQGDSIIISLPNNKSNILIDTGGKVSFNKDKWMQRRKKYSYAKDTTIPYLKSKGIKKIDYLILTHGDYDHMGEAINLVNNFKVEKVIFNCGEFNELEKDLIKVLDKKKIKYYSCIKELNIDDNKLYFLNSKLYDNENDNSSVIYAKLDNRKFLFMGDAGVEVEEDLIEKCNLQDIDVLKVGHHGSKTSSSKEFINEINPKYSIISVGKNNRYGHPNDSVLDNLDKSKIYRTDIDGSIMFKIKNNTLQIETCTP